MSQSDLGPDPPRQRSGSWLPLPRLRGRVSLTTRATLIESNPVGFSVESNERVLVPHVYEVGPAAEDGAVSADPMSVRAVWCHLLIGSEDRPIYRAGFELTDLTSMSIDRAKIRFAEVGAPNKRRVEREPAAVESVPLVLRAISTIQLLSLQEGEPKRVRFSSTLLPSLRSRVGLEIADDARSLDLTARIVDVGPLRSEGGAPRSWLEVEIDDEDAQEFQGWLGPVS